MTAEPLTVARDTPVSAVKVLMEQYGIDYLPVLEAGGMVGMVDRTQLDREPVLSLGLGF
jgi:CBS domain-containing protein